MQLSKGHCSQNDWCSGKRDKLLKNLRSVIDTPIYPKNLFIAILFFHLNSDKLMCYYFTVILKFTGLLLRLSKKWCKYLKLKKRKEKKNYSSQTHTKNCILLKEQWVTDSFLSVCNSNNKFKLQLWFEFYEFIAY